MTELSKDIRDYIKRLKNTPKQCFLVENIDILQGPFRGKESGGLPSGGTKIGDNWHPHHSTADSHFAAGIDDGKLDHCSYFAYSKEPDEMLSRFLSKDADKRQAFINMKPHLSASLTPKISLFKITDTKKIPFIFDNFLNEGESIVGDNIKYSDTEGLSIFEPRYNTRGAGVKSCNIDLKGDNIATSSRIFEVEIEYFFSSLNEIFKQRSVGKHEYSFRDLIAKRAPRPSKTDAEIKAICDEANKAPSTRIFLEFGYADPTGPDWENNPSLRDTINNMRTGIYLDIHNYKLSFSENGNVTLTVSYNGYVEKTSSTVDVFELGLSEIQRARVRAIQAEMCMLQHKLGNQKNKAERKRLQRSLKATKQKIGSIREYGYQSIMGRLLHQNRVYIGQVGWNDDPARWLIDIERKFEKQSLKLTDEGKSEFLNNITCGGYMHTYRRSIRQFQANHGKSRLWKYYDRHRVGSFESRMSTAPASYTVKFIYFGDIFNELCYLLGQEYTSDGSGYILGHLYAAPEVVGEYHGIPLAGYPIAVEYFAEWFERHVIRRGARTRYSVGDFINDMVRGLIGNSYTAKCELGDDDAEIQIQRPYPKFMSTAVEYDKMPFGTRIQHPTQSTSGVCHISGNNSFQWKKLHPKDNTNATQQQLIWAAPGSFTMKKGSGNTAKADAKRGIYHLIQGVDGGIVKKYSLNRLSLNMLENRIWRGWFIAEVRALGNV